MRHIEGGCLCGQARYHADVEPAFVGVCHCTDCQRYSGSAFATVVALPAPALTVTGRLKTFTKEGDSGKPMHRRFCPECGSGVVEEAEALPGIAMINAGTLDDRSWLNPASAIYCDSAQHWVQLGGEMKRFAKTPG
ncbi:MAG TPA: GFA family protein [Stellaceae bacterium]|nr:GFA family protein [Stellaceae bacterium]